jgi:hypothetical protein
MLTELSSRGNIILLDPVDNPLDTAKADLADGVIAASLEAFDAYEMQGLPTHLVNHHVDIRLPRDITPSTTTLSCGYFGELINTVMTDKIAERVDFIHVDTGKQTTDWLTKPQLYNLHYAVRSNNVEAFKPFLKGFTAAACGANLLIQRDQKEAVRWLGDDYPYLLDPNPSEQDVLYMLDKIDRTFGGREWHEANKHMEKIRMAVSDDAIAAEFAAMLDQVSPSN